MFFIATANVMHTIPPALQDRMEVIRLHGYTELEKIEIAKHFLVKKQMEQTGLSEKNIEFTDDAHHSAHPLLHARSRRPQPGARNRQRLPQGRAQGGQGRRELSASRHHRRERHDFLGRDKFRDTLAHEKSEVGLVTGLAWTEVGGSILTTGSHAWSTARASSPSPASSAT